MELFKHLFDQITEEYHDAEKYMRCALKHKDTDRELADSYYTLSRQELAHAETLQHHLMRHVKTHDAHDPIHHIYGFVHDKFLDMKKDVRTLADTYDGK